MAGMSTTFYSLCWGRRTWTADEIAALPEGAVLDWEGRILSEVEVMLGHGTSPYVGNLAISADRSTLTWIEWGGLEADTPAVVEGHQ
jgi:hypothetical protein